MRRVLRRWWKTAQALVAHALFGFPGRKLRVIGVTGTDGKTTTVHLIITTLESAGYTVGALSTIQYQVGTRTWANTSKLTTPSPWALAKLLAHMVRAGCHYVVLECSSQRLDQNGLAFIPFDVAVITNITREHFDYHQNFAGYAAAKRRLFQALNHPAKILRERRNADRGGRIPTVAVANLDDERCASMFREPAERRYGFTLRRDHLPKLNGETSEVGRGGTASISVFTAYPCHPEQREVGEGLRALPRAAIEGRPYVVRAGDREALLNLKLPGTFNLQNALAAIAVGVSQGIELARITRALSEVERIPGRMDRVEAGQPFTVIVDYAVTPAAFDALYGEVSKLKAQGSRLMHVFGAAGERDRGKRPLLGEIAGKNADLVILTDEDPFHENPEQILDEIERGLQQTSDVCKLQTSDVCAARYHRIRDRREAIRTALRHARPGDIVLLTGKGAEETMAVGSQRLPWNDRRVAEEEVAVLLTRPYPESSS